jgi:threonine aldolase
MNRRNFLQLSGLGALPAVTHSWPGLSGEKTAQTEPPTISFVRDGPGYAPDQYIALLGEINRQRPVKGDFYGTGGTVGELLAQFAAITGKEAAIYMPSGTLANQLAIAVLSGGQSKVFVQETSHVYRDEADAAQSVYGKRLVPLAKGRYAFTLEELQEEIGYGEKEEYFKTGIGAISIEIPVRRCNAQVFPIGDLRKISAWCKEKGYKLHLDGARLHLAAAWSGIPVRDYASLFDTVYMCLYKYLGATSGAVLCGSKEIISPMEHLVKVHGGAMYQNWTNASMALHHLQGIDDRLSSTREKWANMMKTLNGIQGIQIEPIPNGSNIFHLRLKPGYDGKKLETMLHDYAIKIAVPDEQDGTIHLHVNEMLLQRDPESIIAAFSATVPKAKV